MYGLVNQAIKDLVLNKFGEQKWKQVCTEAQVPENDFVSMHYYEDAITYKLVGSASKVLQIPAEVVLEEFGKYWVLYTANNGYGPLMDLFGTDFKSCLQNLNNLHSRMGMTMPQLSPPNFKFKEITADVYEVEYISKRQGLCPMVKGLLIGLAEKYRVKTKIDFNENMQAQTKTFTIQILGAI